MLQLPKDFVDLHAPAISSLTLVSELCGEQSPVEHHVHHYLDEAGQKSLNIDVRADAVDGWWQQMGSISFGRFQPPSSHPTASNSPPPWSNNPSRFTVIGFKSYLAQDDFGWVTSSKRHLSLSLQCHLPSIFRSPMCVTNPQTSSLQVTTRLWWLETSPVDVYCILWNGLALCPGMIDLAIWEDSTFLQLFVLHTGRLQRPGTVDHHHGEGMSLLPAPWWVAILQTNMAINRNPQYDQTIHPPTEWKECLESIL